MSPMLRDITLGVVIIVAHTISTAQNLVPNGDFEQHDDCSQGVEWPQVHDWLQPGCTFDPSYRHSCNNDIASGIGMPFNSQGFQYTHSGEGYLLFSAYNRFYSYQQKKITAHLTQPLVAGTPYCVQFWLSLADSSEVRCNLLHGLFTEEVPSACNAADSMPLSQAQVTFVTNMVDTASWHLIEAQYTAAGGEQYFTFGNFLPDTLSDVTYLGPMFLVSRSMFYLDDVYVGSCDVGLSETAAAFRPKLWPNPVGQGQAINVEVGKNVGVITWSIRDALGHALSSGRVASLVNGVLPVPTTACCPGAYTLELCTKDFDSVLAFMVQ